MLCKEDHCEWITKDIILSRGNHFLIFDVQKKKKKISQIEDSKIMFCLKNCLTEFTHTSQAKREFKGILYL